MREAYKHNSDSKNIVRLRWVEFSQKVKSSGLAILTLPSSELNDLELFESNKLIKWEPTETGAYKVTEGKVICFEKKEAIFIEMNKKLVNTMNYRDEIGAYLTNNYNKIKYGKLNLFPVDIINLDFDSCISNNTIKIQDTIKLIFDFQSQHKQPFSFFLTFPETEEHDSDEFKEDLKSILDTNLKDTDNENFITKFKEIESKVKDYDFFLAITLAKIIISTAAGFSFELIESESFLYGDKVKTVGGRKRMVSLLFVFQFSKKNPGKLYYNHIHKCLDNIKELNH